MSKPRKIDLEDFCHRIVFGGDEVVKCAAIEDLELMFRTVLRWKAVSKNVTPGEGAPHSVDASLQNIAQYYKRMEDGGDTRNKNGKRGSSSVEASSGGLERSSVRMKHGVWGLHGPVHETSF